MALFCMNSDIGIQSRSWIQSKFLSHGASSKMQDGRAYFSLQNDWQKVKEKKQEM